MTSGVIRGRRHIARPLGLSDRATIQRVFPRLGDNALAWLASEVEASLKSRTSKVPNTRLRRCAER
jgi:hypothetical protein